MGRLKQIKPRLSAAPSRLPSPLGADRDGPRGRDATMVWRRWYKTARWQRLRWKVLVRDLFTCQCGCGRGPLASPDLVADHIRPHRGDEGLFWDESNLQCLAKVCHDSAKQRAERRGLAG